MWYCPCFVAVSATLILGLPDSLVFLIETIKASVKSELSSPAHLNCNFLPRSGYLASTHSHTLTRHVYRWLISFNEWNLSSYCPANFCSWEYFFHSIRRITWTWWCPVTVNKLLLDINFSVSLQVELDSFLLCFHSCKDLSDNLTTSAQNISFSPSLKALNRCHRSPTQHSATAHL